MTYSLRKPLLWSALLVALCLALAQVPRGAPNVPDRMAELEQVTVDACNLAIRSEFPHAKAGFTRVVRPLADGTFLAVVPFSVGRLQRQARCVGSHHAPLEFGVEVAKSNRGEANRPWRCRGASPCSS